MSNAFKSNSRFAALAEEINNDDVFNKKNKRDNIPVKKDVTSFTSNSFTSFDNNDSYYNKNINRNFESIKSREQREKQEKENEVKKQKLIEEKKLKQLDISSFPDLLENDKKKSTINKPIITQTGFMDKVKFVKPIIDEVKPIETHIKPGWIEMKLDTKTRKIITSENLPTSYITSERADVLKALVSLYERRTNEYIDLWGYDEWEKTFMSPNYDYNYFNKLDELYEEEMETLEKENSYYSD